MIDIIDGISIKLNKVFGDGYTIYLDDVEQDLKEPCFFIKDITSTQSQLLGNRFMKNNSFDIHYFPKAQNSKTELLETAEKLFCEMEWITLTDDSMLHGTGMRAETINGVLHFFVNYNHTAVKETPKTEKMEDLAVIEGVRQ